MNELSEIYFNGRYLTWVEVDRLVAYMEHLRGLCKQCVERPISKDSTIAINEMCDQCFGDEVDKAIREGEEWALDHPIEAELSKQSMKAWLREEGFMPPLK